MKKVFESSAKDAYAVLERLSAVSVNCHSVSHTSHVYSNYSQAYLVATCLDSDRLAELGKTYKCVVDASSRFERQGEAQYCHILNLGNESSGVRSFVWRLDPIEFLGARLARRCPLLATPPSK